MSSAKSPGELGGCAVDRAAETLRARGDDGLRPEPIPVAGLIRPTSVEAVASALHAASRDGVRVYPVSVGRNWGYGASAPVRPGCVVMDLSAMDHLEVDEELATVEVGPGVTQGRLWEALQGTSVMMDATGAGPHTSLIGNVLERGFGHTPMGLRAASFAVTEMVLADGTIVHPADGWAAGSHLRVGLSGGLHELLVQSAYAVVTRMRIWLQRRPERVLRCIVGIDDDARIPALMDGLRRLKEEGALDGLPHVGSDLRGISMMRRFDFDRCDPERGLSDADRAALRAELGVSAWTLACGIYGSKGVAAAKARRVRQVLGPVGRVRIVTDATIRRVAGLLRGLSPVAPSLRARAETLEKQAELLAIMDGYPSELPMVGNYWRHRRLEWRPGADPIADRCGLRWLAPTLPLRGTDVGEMIATARETFREGGFELAATLIAVSPRACKGVLSLYFDGESDAERARATRVYGQLKEALDARGWRSYRLPIDFMGHELSAAPAPLLEVRARLKRALDPTQTLSPGRYEPEEEIR